MQSAEINRTLIFSICLLIVQGVHASWWYLGMASTAYQSTLNNPKMQFSSKCSQIDVLAPHQRQICTKNRNILEMVAKGASLGIDECQFQFHDRRWNCSTSNTTSVFGKVLKLRSREKAYIYAISSAGVMHAITKACSNGELSMCSCDKNIRTRDTKGKFMWGGCSSDVNFGMSFTSEFVDPNEKSNQPDGLMNLWNNQAGRKAVKQNLKLLCKCHGVSGSCSVKICWRTMAPFRAVGKTLKSKFDGASRVRFSKRKKKLRKSDRNQKKPTKKDLVYLEDSPDYCEYNSKWGSLGTRGRECNKTSFGLDGCTLMCCGRGYHTMMKEIKEDCNCKFFWCCRVTCDKCNKVVEKHYCK